MPLLEQNRSLEGRDRMRNLIRWIRDNLLATEDTVCLQRARLVTEAYQRFEDDPPPIRRARAFAHVLQNIDLDLQSNPIFAGNTSTKPRAWMLVPEHGFGVPPQVRIENDGIGDILEGKIPQDIREYWSDRSFGGLAGIGHLAVDMDAVVHHGLAALLERTREYAEQGDRNQRAYRKAMAISLQAVIDWARRYADRAEAAARTETDDRTKQAHLRVARACRHVPAQPARNLFEGLQAMALIHLAIAIEGHGMSVSIGLPDTILAPFIDEDFHAEAATDLLAAFMLKITANSLFGRGYKSQAITVGGVDARGNDRCSELTLCFLDACDIIRVGDPPLFVRWHENIDPQVKRRSAQMLADGLSMPLLIHDSPTVEGLQRCGVTPNDAWDYCVVGCNELAIPGRSMQSGTAMAGTVQYLRILNDILLEYDDPDTVTDMQQLMSQLEQRMYAELSQSRKNGYAHWRRQAQSVPTPFTSALMRGCIERGKDLTIGMQYHVPGLYERQLTNAANALAAIEKLVFEDRSLSLRELVAAMQSDFENEAVRRQILAAPKWGNDDEAADKWAINLVDIRERALNRIDEESGHPTHSVCHVVRSLHYLDGNRIAASPDGRHAWTPVAASIGAQGDVSEAGPTAILRSVLKLDAPEYYRGGYNLNLTLPPPGATPQSVLSLIETFFEDGGQELQINSFDVETLLAARENPDEYGDLIVRLAGLSARFVDMSRAEQDEIIARARALQ